jgi:hypothetical protein
MSNDNFQGSGLDYTPYNIRYYECSDLIFDDTNKDDKDSSIIKEIEEIENKTTKDKEDEEIVQSNEELAQSNEEGENDKGKETQYTNYLECFCSENLKDEKNEKNPNIVTNENHSINEGSNNLGINNRNEITYSERRINNSQENETNENHENIPNNQQTDVKGVLNFENFNNDHCQNNPGEDQEKILNKKRRGKLHESVKNKRIHTKYDRYNMFKKVYRCFINFNWCCLSTIVDYYYYEKNLIKKIEKKYVKTIKQSDNETEKKKPILSLLKLPISSKYKNTLNKNEMCLEELLNGENVSQEVKNYLNCTFEDAYFNFFLPEKSPCPSIFSDVSNFITLSTKLKDEEPKYKQEIDAYARGEFFSKVRTKKKRAQ